MRIQAKDLPVHLQQKLLNFYFVFGEEPLQHQETLRCLRSAAKKAGYADREIFEMGATSNWEMLIEHFKMPNLFSEKQLIECRLVEGKISNTACAALTKLVDSANQNSILFLLIGTKIEAKTQQSSWFNALEKKGCTICTRSLSKEETLSWLEKRLHTNGFTTTPETISLLFERTEGNLLAAAQAIEKIKLYGAPKKLNPEDIFSIVGGESRFNVFDLINEALSGGTARTAKIFLSLKNEGVDPTLLVWAAAREIRTVLLLNSKVTGENIPPTVLNELGIWKRKEPLVKMLRKRFAVAELQGMLIRIKGIDNILKGRTMGNAWHDLFCLYLTLTGNYREQKT
jgi:DNA polymerase-3 subunit delta